MVNLNSLGIDKARPGTRDVTKVMLGTTAPDGATRLTDITEYLDKLAIRVAPVVSANVEAYAATLQNVMGALEPITLPSTPVNWQAWKGILAKWGIDISARRKRQTIKPVRRKRHGGNRGKGKRYAANTKAAHETKKAASALRRLLVSR